MNKHYNKFFDETYYSEKLSNGLQIIVFHKPDFNTNVCSFGTPYGALKINQKYKSKKYHFNPGIAHFLEHKLFEAQGDDIMSVFSSMGANVNAFTSNNETVYYFTKTGGDIEEPLNLLLDFVQELNITDASVKKEKGIIAQEVAMYMQMPNQRLLSETYKCLYKNYPIKNDIGGDKKSVYAITKKELDTCYKINYHPSNMVLVVTTPLDPKKIIKIVKDNQAKKKFKKADKITSCNEKEPNEVVKKQYKFKMPISTDKHVYAIKVKPNFKDANDAFKKEWALRILLETYFSPINPDYQKWLNDKTVNDFFGYDVEFNMEYADILFFIENNDEKVLPKLIEETLKKDLMNKGVLEQIKRRYIGTMFDMFDNLESFNQGFIRDYLGGLDYFKALNDLKEISIYDVKNSRKYLSSPHVSYVSMIKK